ncbi:hypothetical protein CIG75_15290 [Tumebacillus algifaecis]|uniref:Aminoglycoside phosphotransferase domain-containing protein n=1 Tax=Tumebacillus algifaecis TaxID=1214604 RepID=A0A223D3E4_9BACL|nr:CotS family spore coat protein [Tumebacillus algifaecis]ASS76168.1 hypothetical protein CIG75_15290 [Tumebacillus algifaecis]
MVPVKKLLEEHWQLAVEKVTAVGPVWRVQTVQGDFCFKRGKHSLARLFFDFHAIEYLWKQGFTSTPRLISTVYGNPIIQTDDGPFFLTQWVGRPLRSTSKAEWMQAAQTLGEFHQASKGITFPPAIKRFTFDGKWTLRFQERTEELQQCFAAYHKPRNEFENKVHQDASELMTIATQASSAFADSDYERLVAELAHSPSLVHSNVKAENFSVAQSGAVSLIDFDSFRIDLPVQDLANLFQDLLPALNWSPDDALDIFAAYQQARPVDPVEIPVLLAYLAYPHRVYKEIRKYSTQPDRPLQKCLRKWQPALDEMYQSHEFLKKWAIPLKRCVQ